MSQDACVLSTKDHTLLEILLERHADADAAFRSLLRKKLAGCSVVVRDVIPPDVATLNSRISFRINVSETDSRILSFDAPNSPAGLLLPVTKIRGLALLGLREGQEIEIVAADGNVERIHLEQVLYQPEAARRDRIAMARLDTPEARRAMRSVVAGGVTAAISVADEL